MTKSKGEGEGEVVLGIYSTGKFRIACHVVLDGKEPIKRYVSNITWTVRPDAPNTTALVGDEKIAIFGPRDQLARLMAHISIMPSIGEPSDEHT